MKQPSKTWFMEAMETLRDALHWVNDDLNMSTSPSDREITIGFLKQIKAVVDKGKKYES